MQLFLYSLIALFSTSIITSGSSVPQALYACIDGVHGSSIKRIYRGAYGYRSFSILNRLKFLVKEPTITFFDAAGKVIITEKIKNPQDRMETENLVKSVQSRLGQLPKVCAIDVVAFKAPGWKSIEMFDEHGNRIVQTNYGIWGGPVEGSLVSQEIIDYCTPFVSNPDDLKKLTVRHAYYENMITGKKVRVQQFNQ